MFQHRVLTALLVTGLAAASSSALAQSDDSGGAWRFGAFYTNPTAKTNIGGGFKVEGDNVLGFGGDYEFRFNRVLGFDLAAAYAKVPVSVQGNGTDTRLGHLQVYPLTAMVFLHPFKKDSPVDWYFGGGMSYFLFTGDLHIKNSLQPAFGGKDDISIDNTLGWAARTGVDINLGEPEGWALNLDITYNKLEADTDNGFVKQVDVNPFNFGVGLAYRF